MNAKERHVDELPDDWWRHPYAGIDFANYYQRLTLGLLIALRQDNTYLVEILSGLKIVHQDQVLWLTAGHVIDYLNYTSHQFSSQIELMAWLDPATSSEASAFIMHNRKFERYSASSSGVDVGFAVLSNLDAMNILNNPYSILMTDLNAETSRHIEPEGYYLIGYPRELGGFSQKLVNETKVLNSFVSRVVCLPLERILEVKDDWPSDFKSKDNAFFGRLLEFVDDWRRQPESITGMSGGPVFAIGRHPSNKFVYELIGIQSGWLPKRRVITVEPIGQALRFVEKILSNRNLE